MRESRESRRKLAELEYHNADERMRKAIELAQAVWNCRRDNDGPPLYTDPVVREGLIRRFNQKLQEKERKEWKGFITSICVVLFALGIHGLLFYKLYLLL